MMIMMWKLIQCIVYIIHYYYVVVSLRLDNKTGQIRENWSAESFL